MMSRRTNGNERVIYLTLHDRIYRRTGPARVAPESDGACPFRRLALAC